MSEHIAPTAARYLDPRLSRGLVRQEAKGLIKDLDEAFDAYMMTVMPAQRYFAIGKKLPEDFLRNVERKARKLAAEAPAFMSFEVEATLAAMHKSRQVVKSTSLQIAPALNDNFRVEALRVLVSRSSLVVAGMGSPLIFTRHLAERILQRRRHELSAKPVREIGDALSRSIGLIALAARAAHALPERRLSIPYEDGLILGEIDYEEGSPLAVTIFDKDGKTELDREIYIALFPAGRTTPLDKSGSLTFKANTFIGPREMRPEQVALRDKLLVISMRHAPMIKLLATQTLHPKTPGFDDVHGSVTEDDLNLLLAAHTEIEELFKVAGWAKAMGNSAGMPARFFSMRDVFDERKKSARENFSDEEVGWHPIT